MSAKVEINPTAVMMAATHLLTATYGEDPEVWTPSIINRKRDAALDDCARMAWALKEAVEKMAPDQPHVEHFKRSPKFRPVPWDAAESAPGSDPKTLAAHDV